MEARSKLLLSEVESPGGDTEGVTHGVEKVLDAPVVFLRPSVVGSSEEGAVLDGGRVRRRAP